MFLEKASVADRNKHTG